MPSSLGLGAKARVILPAALVLLFLSVLSITLFLRNKTKAEYELRERLVTAAVLGSMQIDPDLLLSIRNPNDLQTEAYRDIVMRLSSIQRTVPHARFVYIVRKAAGSDPFLLEFVADADSLKPDAELDRDGNGVVDPTEEPSAFQELYDGRLAPAMLDAFVAPSADVDVTADKWGTFISGYAPIRDAGGNTIGILGIDMAAQDYLGHAKDFFPLFLLLLFMGMGIIVSLYIAVLSWQRSEQERARTTLLQNLPGMAYRCRNDQEWTMEFLSDGCKDLTGYAPSDLLGNRERSYASLIHADDQSQVWSDVQTSLRSRMPYLLTYRIKTADGREKWVWEQGCGVYAVDGRLLFLEGFIMDITERKSLDRARGDFLQAASHQLRTPIAAVRWSLSTLKDAKECPLQGMQTDIVNDAESYITRMAETVDMMLRVSELESRQTRPTMTQVPLLSLFHEVQKQMGAKVQVKKMRLSLDCPAEFQIRTDAAMLREVLTALLHNAITYSSPGGNIRMRVHHHDGRLCIDVEDHGCGIPAAEQYKVFSQFFRASNATIHSPEGTGLGLSLASALARLLGGTLSFISEEGKGSTFSLMLPSE